MCANWLIRTLIMGPGKPTHIHMASTEKDDLDAFVRMAREFPVRTAIFSFGLPVFACLQVVNGFLSNGSLVFIGLFAALLVAYSVQITRYHVAVYRRKQLYGSLERMPSKID